MEEEHVSRIRNKEGRVYGLTTTDVRHLAYEIAKKLNINHCFSKSTKIAEVDWFKGFLNRYPNLSIRVPTVINLSCAIVFNRVKVILFKTSLRCRNNLLKRPPLKMYRIGIGMR